MTDIAQRIDALLGDEGGKPVDCPVFLEMSEATAGVIVESLRWTLYGGAEPANGRRSLLVVLDALTQALAGHADHAGSPS